MPVSHSTQEIPVLPTDSAVLQHRMNCYLRVSIFVCVCVMGRT